MKKLFIDVDDVICDNGFLVLLNDFLQSDYTVDDFSTYYIEDSVIHDEEQKKEFYKYIANKNTYDNAYLFPRAKEVLEKLNKVYDIYICSSCAIDIPGLKEASGVFYLNKYNYLIENLPFLDINKFIFTGCKNVFKADIQIDDRLSHLQGDVETKLLYSAFHNKEYTDEYLSSIGVTRVNSWDDIERILL